MGRRVLNVLGTDMGRTSRVRVQLGVHHRMIRSSQELTVNSELNFSDICLLELVLITGHSSKQDNTWATLSGSSQLDMFSELVAVVGFRGLPAVPSAVSRYS